MNELTAWQRERILERLRAGRSLRQIEIETGHRRETIANYGRRAGILPPTPLRRTARRESQARAGSRTRAVRRAVR